MHLKLLAFVILTAIVIVATACGGTPKAEIQAAVQEQFNYYGEIPIVSAKKAPYPENSIRMKDAQDIWCVVIDATFVPYNRRNLGDPVFPSNQSLDRVHLLVTRTGLQYWSTFAMEMEYPRLGCIW